MKFSEAFQIALSCYQAGRLSDSEALCRQILAGQPNHAGARRLLGMIAIQAGRPEIAVDLFRQAIAANPAGLQCHLDLGNALLAQGLHEEATAAFRHALRIDPACMEAHYNLGNTLQIRGQLDEAIVAYGAALQLKPDLAIAHNNLGSALRMKGRLDEAVASYRKALQIKPDYVEALNNLGVALQMIGRFDESIAACQRATQMKPDQAEAWYNLGIALQSKGRLDECVAAYGRALRIIPNYAKALNNLGNALRDLGQLDQALVAYVRALELNPAHPETLLNLGAALAGQGRLDEAIAAYRQVIKLKPDFPAAHNNLGNALKSLGELDASLAAYRRALEINPEDASTHSNLVFALHLHPGDDPKTIYKEHQRWNRRFGAPLQPFPRPRSANLDPDRRLRIGYVSPDFRDHPVGRFALPLLEHHDRERCEILGYSEGLRLDSLTERFRGLAAAWRSTVGVSDARLAEMIREDEVDILVDLALHTEGNRLPVFARQPAPIQVAWLGYPGSTGLDSIGYRMTDARVEPLGDESAWSAEERVRLPDCWCCYQPFGDYPEINALPALSAEAVTFGCLNNFTKINEGVLALWARVLDAVQGSRLVMRCPEGSARERVRAFFKARKIAAERVELVGILSRWEYLRLYQRIDLGLDPFPYNGTSTTCDALWMGVPILTLPGAMPASRAGLSLLSSIGLGELATSSEENYVAAARAWSENLPGLAALRASLRSRMQSSPLMDAPRFAQNVEAAYRAMWQAWCAGQSLVRKE